MAKAPKKGSGSRLSNIMALARGEFAFGNSSTSIAAKAFGSSELISQTTRSKILEESHRNFVDQNHPRISNAGIMGVVQASLSRVTSTRIENRQILELMPEVDKAARLMIASTFAPNDLSRQELKITFNVPTVEEHQLQAIGKYATEFFEKKLNLKSAAPEWVYQFGYEAGATVFGVIPLSEFGKILDESKVGQESYTQHVVDQLAQESIFGFSNTERGETIGLESIALESLVEAVADRKDSEELIRSSCPTYLKPLIAKFIGTESLALTDNPKVLQVKDTMKQAGKKKVTNTVRNHFRRKTVADPIMSIGIGEDTDHREKIEEAGNPIILRFPPESVTVIHTPGDPNDHIGYFVLLDRQGNPVDAVVQNEDLSARYADYTKNNNNLFNQLWQANGLKSGGQNMMHHEVMTRIYAQVIASHLKRRVQKVGFEDIELGNSDAVMRCMFSRFLEGKQTRVLFLPHDLVSYMTFKKDRSGNGVSRLEGIKFSLSMKMAVQVARTMASLKAAMDNRRIEATFGDNMMESPEGVIQTIVQEYVKKNAFTFSTDPNQVQNQVINKSLSVKVKGAPGIEEFDIINEPDNRTGSVDFDANIMDGINKDIQHGLRLPASAMNALGEDEYSRSVVTTNLMFAHEVSIDQDLIKLNINDFIRKYGRYSGEFVRGLLERIPSLAKTKEFIGTEAAKAVDKKKTEKKKNSGTPAPVGEMDDSLKLPENFTIDDLIDSMTINLPSPQVAPSKAQFESLEAMVSAITNMVNALFPDELMGPNDSLRSVVALLRAKFISMNVRAYLEQSGMNGLTLPDTNFTMVLKDISTMTQALQNVHDMLEDKSKQKSTETTADTDPMNPNAFGGTDGSDPNAEISSPDDGTDPAADTPTFDQY